MKKVLLFFILLSLAGTSFYFRDLFGRNINQSTLIQIDEKGQVNITQPIEIPTIRLDKAFTEEGSDSEIIAGTKNNSSKKTSLEISINAVNDFNQRNGNMIREVDRLLEEADSREND